ncbi:MAG: phosphoribosylamine--glycine ligase [Nanoarchaeota archaeon]|nr:phosphoribosylamine--glycine ligase [DPANN group archaeon]MBL7116803.1 phosphoribosylamine--glycine ligase [Nanoarchaeota archaeon]
MAKVLIIGSGGREHALGWKLAQSPHVEEVIYAPGNGGTEVEEKGRNVKISKSSSQSFRDIAELIASESIDLTIVGPEDPLANGIVDYLNGKGYNRVFGPTMAPAKLEADKFYSYQIMEELGIQQAQSEFCYSTTEAIIAITRMATSKGIVIKARGLAAGKGVVVCDSNNQALEEIVKHTLKFGEDVLIAERLFGQEFSVFGISDGNQVYPIEISLQDHKPQLDGDKGPNTGGMGAYGPAPIASVDVVRDVAENIMTPVVQRMKERGEEYKGFLYAGMMMTKEGPKVIEFNVRFGDPECQPAMMMIKSDFYETLSLAMAGRLDEVDMEFNPGASCCVVMASVGYPGSYRKGLPIRGIEEVESVEGVKVFHAGTAQHKHEGLITSGGRVLGVTPYSPEGIKEARELAYSATDVIQIASSTSYRGTVFHFRRDIASKALED